MNSKTNSVSAQHFSSNAKNSSKMRSVSVCLKRVRHANLLCTARRGRLKPLLQAGGVSCVCLLSCETRDTLAPEMMQKGAKT
jgi:hypothetical protein